MKRRNNPDQNIPFHDVDFVYCRRCSCSIPMHGLVEHYYKNHRKVDFWIFSRLVTDDPLRIISCPLCGHQMIISSLVTHFNKFHDVQETLKDFHPDRVIPKPSFAKNPDNSLACKRIINPKNKSSQKKTIRNLASKGHRVDKERFRKKSTKIPGKEVVPEEGIDPDYESDQTEQTNISPAGVHYVNKGRFLIRTIRILDKDIVAKDDIKPEKEVGSQIESKIPSIGGPLVEKGGSLINYDLWKESIEIEKGKRDFGISFGNTVNSSKSAFEDILKKAETEENKQNRRKREKTNKGKEELLLQCIICNQYLAFNKFIPHMVETHADKNPIIELMKEYAVKDPKGIESLNNLYMQIREFGLDVFLEVIKKMSWKGKRIYDSETLRKSFAKPSGKFCPMCNLTVIRGQLKEHIYLLHTPQNQLGRFLNRK